MVRAFGRMDRKMRPLFYRLGENHVPVPADSALGMQWDRVAFTKFLGVDVSTVFLSVDHAHDGAPVLFETVIFGGPLNGEQWRYRTWDEAVEGHRRAVRRAFWAPFKAVCDRVRSACRGK